MNGQKLYCVVGNSQELKIGLKPEFIFSEIGGTIGSSPNADWQLKSDSSPILEKHCTITVIDDQYCLIDHSGDVYINHSLAPITPNVPIALGVEDVVKIGNYNVRFQTFLEREEDPLRFHKHDLTSIFSSEHDNNLVPEDCTSQIDPLSALEITQKDEISSDSNSSFHLDAVIGAVPKNFEEIESHFYDPNAKDWSGKSHYVLSPLLKGLDAKISTNLDSSEVQYIAEEIGASLKEAIQGLLKLYEQNKLISHNASDKAFQPIIDNPLQMGLSYDETAKLLFDSKTSLVHLAAPAAMRESLELLADHHKATETAINYALMRILDSISPERLMERFNYYRSARNLPPEDREAWAWKMYQAYYQELTSSRQTGFNKLFWELFDQCYDKEIRDLQDKKPQDK